MVSSSTVTRASVNALNRHLCVHTHNIMTPPNADVFALMKTSSAPLASTSTGHSANVSVHIAPRVNPDRGSMRTHVVASALTSQTARQDSTSMTIYASVSAPTLTQSVRGLKCSTTTHARVSVPTNPAVPTGKTSIRKHAAASVPV